MKFNTDTQFVPKQGIIAIVFIISVFAILICRNSYNLRNEIRRQIITRDSEVLYPVTVLQISKSKEKLRYEPWSLESDIDLLSVVLDTSELKGVVSVRLFDIDGKITEAVPKFFTKGVLSKSDLIQIKNQQPLSRYYANSPLNQYASGQFEKESISDFPMLEVVIPLHDNTSNKILGIAQFLIDGRDIKNEFSKLDKNLLRQSFFIFISGSVVISLILFWSYYRLNVANRLLTHRSHRLQEANRELTLAAKTSAVGAITAHVLHGLSNPLSGIREYVNGNSNNVNGTDDNHRVLVKESTQKMEQMIHDIITMLRENNDTIQYDYTFNEIFKIVINKNKNQASKKNIQMLFESCIDESLENHRSNILIMILMNLVQNAIDAIATAGIITLSSEKSNDQIDINIRDTGKGIPEEIREKLFHPIRTTKKKGSGIGLSISRQLARHLGGELTLRSTDKTGTCFNISLPLSEEKLYDKESN